MSLFSNRLIFNSFISTRKGERNITLTYMMSENSTGSNRKGRDAGLKNLKFLATISHEIRNPANAILGIARLLKNSISEEERDLYLDSLTETSESLIELINNILDFGKTKSGALALNPVPTDLSKMTEQKLKAYKAIAEAKGLQFEIDVEENIPEVVMVDQVKILQVLINLVSNAVKFTLEGSIKVGVKVEVWVSGESFLRFFIQDTGIGISEERIDLIFEAFHQGGDEVNLSYGGTGLGLSISREIVKMLGGNLTVRSRKGEGAEFSFSLPLILPSEPIKHSLPKSRKNAETFQINLKLLIVDDDKLNLLVLEKQLANWGFQVVSVRNGFDAIKKVREESFDMVLMDLHMSGMDGFAATAEIRKLTGKDFDELRIIGLTASTDLSRETMQSAGFTDVITKPFLPEDLLDKIILYGNRLQET